MSPCAKPKTNHPELFIYLIGVYGLLNNTSLIRLRLTLW